MPRYTRCIWLYRVRVASGQGYAKQTSSKEVGTKQRHHSNAASFAQIQVTSVRAPPLQTYCINAVLLARPRFGKLITYSVPCLANLAVDEVSIEEMIDEGALEVRWCEPLIGNVSVND